MNDPGFLSDQILQILLVLVALGLVWLVLRSLLRLTLRIFSIGCTVILALGLCAVVYRLFI